MLHFILAAALVAWPDTPAASMAKEWVKAFASEDAMRAFLIKNVPEESLKERTIDERLATYRESKKKFGTLKLGSIISSKPAQLKAKLVAKDGSTHDFTFNVQPQPPHKMTSITRTEMQNHGFSWLPGH